MKHFNYIYITTNIINGKQYIGDHSTNNLDDGYLGSGELIHKAIKKYGKQNFKKEILEQFNTKKEAFDAQEKYINQFNTLQPMGYNISPRGGHQVSGGMSEDGRKKLSEFHKGRKASEETKKRLSESLKLAYKENRKSNFISLETKQKISNTLKGRSLSSETKQKISNILKGRTYINLFGNEGAIENRKIRSESNKNVKRSEEIKKRMSLSKIGNTNAKGGKGKKLSDETKQKISESWKLRRIKIN
jgi:hypothetical protein